MGNKRTSTGKYIQGIPADEYFGEHIGPMAVSILDTLLYKFIQTQGEGMTGAQMKLVQFAIERSYGTATRRVEAVHVSEQEIVAEKLAELDESTLRLIANTNAPKTIDNTIN